jgi:hypothetical protein
MTDADGFRIEAAEQFGFEPTDGDMTGYVCTEAQLIAFAKACERKGLFEAHGLANRDAVHRRILDIDAELAPILAAEEERYMTSRGYVRGTDEPGKRWVKPATAALPTAPANDFWCVVALDYNKDEAWILDRSTDAVHCDLLDGSSGDDNGLLQEWVKTAVPGLYKLALSGWSAQSHEGEWDSGVDVDSATLLVAFPDREPRPTEFLVSAVYGCTDDFHLDDVATKAVGREIDECGWCGGERDIGWICESEDEVEQVKTAIESVGLVADVSEWSVS